MELEKNHPEPANAPQPAAPAAARGATQALEIPDDALILVPVRNLVLFPGMVLPVTIGRELSVAAAQAAVKADKPIGLLLQKDPKVEKPGPADLNGVGTVAQILRYITTPDGTNHIVSQGEARFRVVEFLDGYPFLVARVERITQPDEVGSETEARLVQLKERAVQALELLPETPQEMVHAVQSYTSAGQLADMVAGFMDVKPAEKQAVLETFAVEPRVDRVLGMLAHRIEVLKLSREIESRTKATMD